MVWRENTLTCISNYIHYMEHSLRILQNISIVQKLAQLRNTLNEEASHAALQPTEFARARKTPNRGRLYDQTNMETKSTIRTTSQPASQLVDFASRSFYIP